MSARLQPILSVEDEETDQFLLNHAFKRAKIPCPLVTVADGMECVDYLSGVAPFADRATHPLPSLVLLDLKMPRMDGFEVLAWLSSQRDFKDLPVVVLSSSAAVSDVEKARRLGARDYLTKPLGLDALVKMVLDLHSRWAPGAPEAGAQ